MAWFQYGRGMRIQEAYSERQRLGIRVVNDVLVFPVGRSRDKTVKLRECEVEPMRSQYKNSIISSTEQFQTGQVSHDEVIG